jgi:hypothetical protein
LSSKVSLTMVIRLTNGVKWSAPSPGDTFRHLICVKERIKLQKANCIPTVSDHQKLVSKVRGHEIIIIPWTEWFHNSSLHMPLRNLHSQSVNNPTRLLTISQLS